MGMPAALIGSAAISGGASLIGAGMQASAAQKGLKLQGQQYAQTRADLAPYAYLGYGALPQIAALYGMQNPLSAAAAATTGGVDSKGKPTGAVVSPGNYLAAASGSPTPDYSAFYNSPDYQFALQQGTLALDRSAAAKGLLTSGGQLKDLTTFGQGLASQQYGNYFNRLMQVAGLGQSAAAGTAQASQAYGNAGANQYNTIGGAQASGMAGLANSFSNLPQNLLFAQMYGNPAGVSSYATPSGYAGAPTNLTPSWAGTSLGTSNTSLTGLY